MIRTESYVYETEEYVEVGTKYYFGSLWSGSGDGKELLESGAIAMYTETEGEEVIVNFEIIDHNEDDICQSIVKVTDIL